MSAQPLPLSLIHICVERRLCQPARIEAKTNDVQADRGQKFHLWLRGDPPAKSVRLLDVARDHPPESLQTMLLDRHPDFERTKLSRQLQPIIAEPELPRRQPARFMRQIFRRQRKGAAMGVGMAHQDAARLEGHVHPFVPVSYTHLDVYKRQNEYSGTTTVWEIAQSGN